MEKNGWQVLAIIFIVLSAVLFLILTIETIFIIVYFISESDLEQKEIMCDINICSQFDKYNSYTFDEYTEVCYCYDNDGETLHQEYVQLSY